MPWIVGDVDGFIEGLTTEQKPTWVAIANAARESYREQGGRDCDRLAITRANSAMEESMDREILDEADRSHEITRDLLRAAVAPVGDSPYGAWVRDVYDDWFVYTVDDTAKTYKRSYVIDDKDTVTLGDSEEVVATMTYVPVGEAQEAQEVELVGDIMALTERAVADDNSLTIKLIQPGWGSSGYYSPKVLERDGAKVFPAGTKMYWDHATATQEKEKPEGSLDRLVGKTLTDAAWRPEGADGAGLYADAMTYEKWGGLVNELAPDIGMSIRAMGRVKEGEADGKKGPIITELTAAKSVDYVTTAGAGGKVLQLFESARTHQEDDIEMEKEMKELQEANDALVAENETQATEIVTLKAVRLDGEIKAFVSETLAEAEMPEPTRQKLTTLLGTIPVIVEGKLDQDAYKVVIDEAVTAELAYLASVGTKPGAIRGMGESTPPADGAEKLHEAEIYAWIQLGKTQAEAEELANLAAQGR